MSNEPSNEPILVTPPRGEKKWWIVLFVLSGLVIATLILQPTIRHAYGGVKTIELNATADGCFCILVDNQGRIWTTDNSNLIIYDPELKVTKKDTLVGKRVTGLIKGAQGQVWVSANDGAYIFSPDGKLANHYQSDVEVVFYHLDMQGNMWAWGDRGPLNGILIIHPDGSQDRLLPPLSDHNSDIAFDSEGRAWVLGPGNQIFILDSHGKWITYTASTTQPPAQILFLEKQDRMWISDLSGIEALSTDGKHIEYINLAGNSILSMAVDKDGRVWVGTDAGLDMLDTNGKWITYTTDNSGLTGGVGAIAFDAHGMVWFLNNDYLGGHEMINAFDPSKHFPLILPLLSVSMRLVPTFIILILATVIRILYLRGRKRELEILASLIGWYLINGLIWYVLYGGSFESTSPNFYVAYGNVVCTFPLNILLLLILGIKRPKTGLGILLAIVLNFFISIFWGSIVNGVVLIPFFVN